MCIAPFETGLTSRSNSQIKRAPGLLSGVSRFQASLQTSFAVVKTTRICASISRITPATAVNRYPRLLCPRARARSSGPSNVGIPFSRSNNTEAIRVTVSLDKALSPRSHTQICGAEESTSRASWCWVNPALRRISERNAQVMDNSPFLRTDLV